MLKPLKEGNLLMFALSTGKFVQLEVFNYKVWSWFW